MSIISVRFDEINALNGLYKFESKPNYPFMTESVVIMEIYRMMITMESLNYTHEYTKNELNEATMIAGKLYISFLLSFYIS